MAGSVEGTRRWDIQTNVIYIGYAPRGSPTTRLVWSIRRITMVNKRPTRDAWAIDVAWDDRAVVPYT